MIQSLIQQTAYAFVAALMILGAIMMLGIGLGNRERLREKHIDVYAWAIILPVTAIGTLYFGLVGAFTLTETIQLLVLLLLFSLCTDWSKIRKDKPSTVAEVEENV